MGAELLLVTEVRKLLMFWSGGRQIQVTNLVQNGQAEAVVKDARRVNIQIKINTLSAKYEKPKQIQISIQSSCAVPIQHSA